MSRAQWPASDGVDSVLPVIDLRTALLNERVDGLEAIRRLQRPAQHTVHPEAMQRQGLVEAFRQTAGRGWFRSSSSCWSGRGRRGPRRTPDGCRRAGDAAATPAAHAWPRNSPRSRACATDTVALGRGGGKLVAQPPGAPCRQITSSPCRPRSTKDRRNGVNTFRSRCPSRRSPGTVCPPSSVPAR